MIHKVTYAKLRKIIREAILTEEEKGKRGGPVDRAKAWEPPDNMVHGSSATSWSQWDDWDSDSGAFDMGLDEADEESVDEAHHEDD